VRPLLAFSFLLAAACGGYYGPSYRQKWPVVRERARFEMNCQELTARPLFSGEPRTTAEPRVYFEYAVSGCGKRAIYRVLFDRLQQDEVRIVGEILDKLYCAKCYPQAEAEAIAACDRVAVTTSDGLEGHRVLAYLGIESVEIVIGTGILTEFMGSLADLAGERSTGFEKKLQDAKLAAISGPSAISAVSAVVLLAVEQARAHGRREEPRVAVAVPPWNAPRQHIAYPRLRRVERPLAVRTLGEPLQPVVGLPRPLEHPVAEEVIPRAHALWGRRTAVCAR